MFACDILCSVPLMEVKGNRILQHIYISSIESLLLMKNICLALASNRLPFPLKEFPSLPFSERRLHQLVCEFDEVEAKNFNQINFVDKFCIKFSSRSLSFSLSHSVSVKRQDQCYKIAARISKKLQNNCKVSVH